MITNWLRIEHRFIGRVNRSGGWEPALIILKQNLSVLVYLPSLIGTDDDSPDIVEGQIDCWKIKIESGAGSFTFRHDVIATLIGTIQLSEEEKNIFPAAHRNGIWTKITYMPERCMFIKNEELSAIPEEWGITYYPGKSNSTLFHLFETNRNPRSLPNIFSVIDRSLYFENSADWTLNDLQLRLRLLTSCLSLFAGVPITCELLVGRKNKDVICVQIENIENPNEYICPSRYNSYIEIRDEFVPHFSSTLLNRVEELTKKKESEKCLVILAYSRMLLMAHYDEAKIAFSFQLMEALAKYKGIHIGGQLRNVTIQKLLKRMPEKFCENCLSVLKKEIRIENDEVFDKFIEKALDAINEKEVFDVDPVAVKRIARWYRNEVFHGSFFEDMAEIDDQIKVLPEGYKRDLPLVIQAIALIMATNFIIGIDFKHMLALKRELL